VSGFRTRVDEGGQLDIWLLDLARRISARFTFESSHDPGRGMETSKLRLMIEQTPSYLTQRFAVVLNWFEELKRRVPVN
jgi:hypothetical protein